MEETFGQLREKNQNNVDGLISWMKSSSVITSKEAEDKARSLFGDAKDKSNIELAKFKEVLSKLAAEQGSTVDEITQKLAQGGNAVVAAVAAGASALKDAFKMK